MFTAIKTFLLLVPIAWFIMEGPRPERIVMLGALLGFVELSRIKGAISSLTAAWPMAVMLLLYIFARAFAPPVAEFQETYSIKQIFLTLVYSIPVGFCLFHWNQAGKLNWVFLGYIVFCLSLALAGFYIVRNVGLENIIKTSTVGVSRTNTGETFNYWRFFSITNVIIGIVPLTILALSSMSALFLSGQIKIKLLLGLAVILAAYENLSLYTRAALAAAFTSMLLLIFMRIWRSPAPNKPFKPGMTAARNVKIRPRSIVSLLVRLGLVIGCVVIIIIFLVQLNNPAINNIFDRILKASDDTRWGIWDESMTLIFRYPFGGGLAHLHSENWAHNLFLDVGLAAGVPGVIVMGVLFAFIWFMIWRAANRTALLSDSLGVALTASFVGCFFVSMVHPPMVGLIALMYIVGVYALAFINSKPQSRLHRRKMAPANPSSAHLNDRLANQIQR